MRKNLKNVRLRRLGINWNLKSDVYTVYTIDFLSIELIGVELNSRLSGAQIIS